MQRHFLKAGIELLGRDVKDKELKVVSSGCFCVGLWLTKNEMSNSLYSLSGSHAAKGRVRFL